jgi:hypothetical protein
VGEFALEQIKNVTGTAFVMAEFRAEENDATDPLYRDPVVHLFLNEKSQQAAEHIATGFPLMKEMVKIRTRYLTICWTVGSLQAAAKLSCWMQDWIRVQSEKLRRM